MRLPTLALLTLGVVAVPSTALAIDVECSDRNGTCSVSNEPADAFSCTCDDGASDGGGGTEDWIDLSERELMMVCEGLLEDECGPVPATGGMTTGMGGDTGGDGAMTTGMGDDTGAASTAGDETGAGDDGADSPPADGDGTPPPDDDGAAVNTTGATSGGDTGGDDGEVAGDDEAGCAITSDGGGPGALVLALVGLLGRHRRRRGG